MKKQRSITKKLKDQVTAEINNNLDTTKNPTLWLGSTLVALSGLLLFLDKAIGFFNINFTMPSHYQELGWDFVTFIWFTAQTICPILLIIGVFLKAHKFSYFVPLYFYLVQAYMVLFDFKIIDNKYYYTYGLISFVFFLLITRLIKNLMYKSVKKEIAITKQQLLDANI